MSKLKSNLFCFLAKMIAIIAKHGRLRILPSSRCAENDHRLSCIVVNANVVFNPSVDRFSPAVNGESIALDDIVDHFLSVELEVRFDRCCIRFHIVVIALHSSQMPSMRRVSKQIAATLRINRSRVLDQNFLSVE